MGVSPAEFNRLALHWATGFPHCVYLESNDLSYPQGAFQRLLAVASVADDGPASLNDLRPWLRQNLATDPVCGFITYDVKNEIEALNSQQFQGVYLASKFTSSGPEIWLCWRADGIEIHGAATGVLDQILTGKSRPTLPHCCSSLPCAHGCPKPIICKPLMLSARTF